MLRTSGLIFFYYNYDSLQFRILLEVYYRDSLAHNEHLGF